MATLLGFEQPKQVVVGALLLLGYITWFYWLEKRSSRGVVLKILS